MQFIKDLLQKYNLLQPEEKPLAKTERQEIFNKIVAILEEDRKRSGRKPLGAGFYAIKMARSGIKTTQDLYWFHGYLSDSKNYAATFWWSTNPKNCK